MECPVSGDEGGLDIGAVDDSELTQACSAAERSAKEGKFQEAEAALRSLGQQFPHAAEPRVSLARVYRDRAIPSMYRPVRIDRQLLVASREQVLKAIALEFPARMATLALLQKATHDLAMHAEQATFFTELARTDGRAEARFEALCWASVALECLGMEAEAAGDEAEGLRLFGQAVERHREALGTWPDAPLAVRVGSYAGHVRCAYRAAGDHWQWIQEMEELLSRDAGRDLPAPQRIQRLQEASDMASDAGLADDAVRLAELALAEVELADDQELPPIWHHNSLCSFLRAYHVKGDVRREEAAARSVLEYLSDWERAAADGPPVEPPDYRSPAVGYHVASRYFEVIKDWGRSIEVASRAAELWDFGTNHYFLAIALWAGRKDRDGTLCALRNAARHALWSGRFACRNLRDDFLSEPVFADVRDDPEFLAVVEAQDARD